MNPRQDEVTSAVREARQALRDNRRNDARRLAERAASLAPEMEDPWLILAAIASPRDSLEYIQKALQINPDSPRAHRGMQWAMQRLQAEEGTPPQAAAPAEAPQSVQPSPAGPTRNRAVLAAILVAIGLIVCIAAALTAFRTPVLASILQQAEPTQEASWAQVEIPKPTYTPAPPLAFEMQPTLAIDLSPTPGGDVASDSSPTDQPTPAVEITPDTGDQPTADLTTVMPPEEPTQELSTPEPPGSGSITLAYVEDTPTSAAAPASSPAEAGPGAGHWIDVNLSQQMVYAYDGDTVVNSFLVSTGTWLHPTVTGQYHVYIKLRYTDMSGPDYYLPNVPYTMYFFKGYGLHGTYWHHNFGTPMSHGCVNLSIPDSAWLYSFASVGTLVNVHY